MKAKGKDVADLLDRRPDPRAAKRNFIPLIGLILLLAVTGFVLGEWAISARSRTILEDSRHRASVILENRVGMVEGWMARWRDETQPLRSNPMVRLFAEQVGKQKLRGAGDAEAAVYLQAVMDDVFRRRGDVAAAYLLDRSGRAFLATSAAQPLSENQREQARLMFASGGEKIDRLRPLNDGLVFDLYLPLHPAQAGTESAASASVAVLLVVVRADSVLTEALASGRTLEEDEKMALIQDGDQADAVLFSGSKDGVIAPFTASTGLLDAAGRFGKSAAPFQDGEAYLRVQDVPATPWRLLYARDARSIDGALVEVRVIVDLLVLALAISISAGIFLLWWRQSLQASQQLTEQYRDFAMQLDARHRLLNAINDAIVETIFVTDASGQIVYANGSAQMLLGMSAARSLGRNADSLLSPSLAARFAAWDRAVIEENRSVNEIFLDPGQADGPRWLDVRKTPFPGAEDGPPGVVTVCRDVTEEQTERERRRVLMQNTIRVLTSSVAAADPYLTNHAAHMAEVAEGIARILGESEDGIVTLRTASALSQTGKIFLPRELIRKEVRLTKEERRQMERHIDLTLEAIKDIQFDLPVPDTLAEMHERLDGSGYPKGVSGDAISRLGRILAVADVYAARTAPRSYRRAATPEDVLDILRNNGAKYDERVVAALESYLKREKGRSPQGGASGKT